MSADWRTAKRMARDVGSFRGPVFEYPPAMFWKRIQGAVLREVWRGVISRRNASSAYPVGIFVNVPFCSSDCRYCDYVRVGSSKSFNAFLRTIREDADALGLLSREQIDFFYVSGGSIADVSAANIQKLVDYLSLHFRLRSGGAISIGLGHMPLAEDVLNVFRRWGVSKAVLQVQSLDPVVSRSIGRPASRAGLSRLVFSLREAGVRKIKIDWMVGFPEQTMESFQSDAKAVFALGPDEIVINAFHPGANAPLRALADGTWRPDMHFIGAHGVANRARIFRCARELVLEHQRRAGAGRFDPVAERASTIGLGHGAISRAWGRARHARSRRYSFGVEMSAEQELRAWVICNLADGGAVDESRLREIFGDAARFPTGQAVDELLTSGVLARCGSGWRISEPDQIYRRVAAAYLYESEFKKCFRPGIGNGDGNVERDLAMMYSGLY